MSERIKKLKETYQDRLSKFNQALVLPRKTNDPGLLLLPLMDKQHENYGTDDLGYDSGGLTPLGYTRSHMNNLYGRLIKNARSLLDFEREAFPSLPYSIEHKIKKEDLSEIITTHHNFGESSPRLSAAFTSMYPVLQRITNTLAPTSSNGNVSCLGISSGESKVKRFDTKLKIEPVYPNSLILTPGSGIKEIRDLLSSNLKTLKIFPELIKQCHTDKCKNNGLTTCPEPEHTNKLCMGCQVCKEHGKILDESLRGITKPTGVFGDPTTIGADNDRALHFKNLISTINSLANHLSDHGGNEDTCEDYDWRHDGMDHMRATDVLRQMSQVLTSSASIDNNESIASGGAPGGFQHRDNIPKVSRVLTSFFGVFHKEQESGDEY